VMIEGPDAAAIDALAGTIIEAIRRAAGQG
jgi:hypothetical protein